MDRVGKPMWPGEPQPRLFPFVRAGTLSQLANEIDRTRTLRAAVRISEARNLAETLARDSGQFAPLSASRFEELWRRFERFAAAFSVYLVDEVTEQLARDFVASRSRDDRPPSVATQHLRRSALRKLFELWRLLAITDASPLVDLELARRPTTTSRALTDAEVEQCRWASLGTTVETADPWVWAIAEAGATAIEIWGVKSTDLDLPNGRVWLSGGAKRFDRWGYLSDWGTVQARRRRRQGVVAMGKATNPNSARSTVAASIKRTLVRAGLGDEPVSINSVTAWAGRHIMDDSGRIECVALGLGLLSLDRAASLIGWDWRAQQETRGQ